jgi:ketosteroid isomerase-like protein
MSNEEFRATNRVFEEEVVGRGDFGALDRVYTRDARILPPGSPMITGRAAIADFWRGAAEALRPLSP